MDKTRRALVGFGAISLLAGCGASDPAPAAEAPDSLGDLTGWESIAAEDVRVPEGIGYNQITARGLSAVEISNVPDDAVSGGETGSVAVRLSDEFETQASGAQILVTVRAMSPDPGAILGVAYSTNEVGNSGWQRFALSAEPTNYVFGYVAPPKRAGAGDFLAFRSYGPGRVQVLGFKTEVALPG
jgi:hypothetical protein